MNLKDILSNTVNMAKDAGFVISKNAPAIFGVAAIGLAAYGVYETVKSTRVVDKHISEFEERKANGEEITTKEFISTIGKDIWKPCVAFACSAAAGIAGYKVMNYRLASVTALATGLATRLDVLEKAVDKKYGSGTTEKLEEETYSENAVEMAKNGEEVLKAEFITIPSKHTGMALSDAEDFVSDDMAYMRSWIGMKSRLLQERFAQKGHLSVNYIIEALGGDKIKEGGVLGFNDDHPFIELSLKPITIGVDDDGVLLKEYWIDWGTPCFLYGSAE